MTLIDKLFYQFRERNCDGDKGEVITVESGYMILADGDVVRPDGSRFEPGQAVALSTEHFNIALARRKRGAHTG